MWQNKYDEMEVTVIFFQNTCSKIWGENIKHKENNYEDPLKYVYEETCRDIGN